jgi:hypothetical protein
MCVRCHTKALKGLPYYISVLLHLQMTSVPCWKFVLLTRPGHPCAAQPSRLLPFQTT